SENPVSPPDREDYFPINAGNQWTYSFRNWDYSPGGITTEEFTGTTVWDIVSLNDVKQSKVYTVRERFGGVKIRTWNYGYAQGADTAYIPTKEVFFSITESATDSITFSLIPDSSSIHPPDEYVLALLHTKPFKRYGDPSSIGDTLTIGEPYPAAARIAKHVGVVFYEYNRAGNGHTHNRGSLVGYDIK
ncbi:MAG: hypothetical protein AABZ61_08745, partial [Bacteroidota bacterium]